MGGLKKIPPEGGSGGKRGYSAMEHWRSRQRSRKLLEFADALPIARRSKRVRKRSIALRSKRPAGGAARNGGEELRQPAG